MRRLISFLALTLIVISGSLSMAVFAEEVDEGGESSNEWLQISPVSERFFLKSGKKEERTFKVENIGEDKIKVRVYADSFFNIEGGSNLKLESDSGYTKLSKWVSFLDDKGEYGKELEFKLSVGESKEIKYRVVVPEDTAGGGQYATIFAETVPEKSQGITTTNRVGILIFSSIEGEIRTGSEISNVKADSISMNGKIGVKADVENTGNVDFQASVDITVSGFFGGELYNDTTVFTVLPESIRNVHGEWENAGFGLFRLHYVVKALDNVVDKECVVLLLPVYIIVIGIVIIASTVMIVVYSIKKKKQNADR